MASGEQKTTPAPEAEKLRMQRSMGASAVRGGEDPDDPVWCWCGSEIVCGAGQCGPCQEEAEDA